MIISKALFKCYRCVETHIITFTHNKILRFCPICGNRTLYWSTEDSKDTKEWEIPEEMKE